MGNEETLRGARGRILSARALEPAASFYVGMEGGCLDGADSIMAGIAWMVVHDQSGNEGKAQACSFDLPQEVAALVRSGVELGDATDQIFKLHNTKQKGGCIGCLTDNRVTRQAYYEQPMQFALIPFHNKSLYPQGQPAAQSDQ